MKVAVFGGTGFVGSYIIENLLAEGHSPKLLVRSESIYKVPSVGDCELIIGDINDKASGGSSGVLGAGWDVTLSATDELHGMAGLTLDVGMSEIEQDATVSAISGDIEEQTFAIRYATGAFTLGYQWSEEDMGRSSSQLEYTNTGYGVTFNVNDDLSIGYNHYESEQDNDTDVTAEATSIQIAYSMGGASIRLADISVDNAAYQTGADYDKDGTVLSVSLAF